MGGGFYNAAHLLLLPGELPGLPCVVQKKQNHIYSGKNHQPQHQTGCGAIGFIQHFVGNADGEDLQQHPVAVRQLCYIGAAGAVGIGIGKAGGTVSSQCVCQNVQRGLVRTVILTQGIENVLRHVFLGAGDHRSVGKTQVGVGRLPKVGGGDDIPHLLLPVAPGEDAHHPVFLPQGGIEDDQILTADPAVENHVDAGVSIQPVPDVLPVGRVGLPAAAVRKDTVRVYITDIVKNRGFHQFVHEFQIRLFRIRALLIDTGNGADAVFGADQKIINALCCLGGRVRDIIGIAFQCPAAGGAEIDEKARQNQTKQESCRYDAPPQVVLFLHLWVTPPVCFWLRERMKSFRIITQYQV